MARKRKGATESTGPDEIKTVQIHQQVVIIEETGRVRRHGFTNFGPSLRDGEKILESGTDFEGTAVFDPGITEAVWRWKRGKFVMERKHERGEEIDWSK